MVLSTATRDPQLEATNGILYTLSTLAVALRLYTRSRIIRKVGTSDWWMLAAWFVATGQMVLWTIYDTLGNGQHIWTNENTENLPHFFLVSWIVQMEYPLGLFVIKTSVLFLYHELFPSDHFRLIIHLVMAFVAVMSTATAIAFVFQCTPVYSYWTPELWLTKQCVDAGALSIATSALSVSTDVVILLMPMKFLLALRISTREKIQLISLMSLGALTCIASIMRFRAIQIVYASKDPSWDGYDLSFWSSFEFFLAMITACIPTIKPLWVQSIQKLRVKYGKKESSTPTESPTRPKFIQPVPEFPV